MLSNSKLTLTHPQTCSDQHFYPLHNNDIDFMLNKLANEMELGEMKELVYLRVNYTPSRLGEDDGTPLL